MGMNVCTVVLGRNVIVLDADFLHRVETRLAVLQVAARARDQRRAVELEFRGAIAQARGAKPFPSTPGAVTIRLRMLRSRAAVHLEREFEFLHARRRGFQPVRAGNDSGDRPPGV